MSSPRPDRYRVALLATACAYLFLLPTGALSFWRSLAFAASAALTAAVALRMRARGETMPPLGAAIPAAVAAWAAWSIASLVWSVDPASSAQEIKAEVVWGLATLAIFWVAAGSTPFGFAALSATLLAGLALWTALALGFTLSDTGWNVRPFHRGEGAFATYLVTVAPFLALVAWRPPVGVGRGIRSLVVAALLVGLVLACARMSDNRILWLAFAASVIILAVGARPRVSTHWKVGAAGLVVVLALLFVDAARQRAVQHAPSSTSVGATLAADPRLAIWKHAAERIRARPWTGYGFGLHILGAQIGADTGDPRVRHPHNLFASQWLQTGAIGVALFTLMLAAVGARYVRFMRAGDVTLARVGALGLAVLAAFVIRNLTDDFFIRANGKILFAAHATLLALGGMRMRNLAVNAAAAPAAAGAR